jgi:hypothetical protein
MRTAPTIVEFRDSSVWVVSASATTSRMLLDPFGVISQPTARDIIIDVGQAQEERTLEKHNE